MRGRVGLADVPALCERIEALLDSHRGDTLVCCDVGALSDADIGTVGALARMQLTAWRHGGRVWLRGASPELRELIGLAGLEEVVPCSSMLPGLLPVEARGQAEEREEVRGVKEERDPGDAVP